ncbi:hypothetical protein PspLS_02542 [Pyricularia sp. CBS 133598]|nr:hypothetical protein PspLS_02542 [Pyricularia sp. CBS 133598]
MQVPKVAVLLAALNLGGSATSVPPQKPGCGAEIPAVRTYFMVGGQYVDDGTGTGEHVFRDQMYVEKLLPVQGVKQKHPLVLIHGQAQTGTNFLNKPDGGRGWASLFVREGYEVYVVDQTLRGRSAWQPGHNADKQSTYSAELISKRFTAVQKYNLWPQAVNHTQWPGSGEMGDPVFDAFYSSNVQFVSNATYQQETVRDAGAKLLDIIGRPAILVGHSQGGILPLVIADAKPDLTAGLIMLEPTGPPFREAVFSEKPARAYGLTDIPLAFDPAVSDPAKDLVQQVFPARADGGVNGSSVDCVMQKESDPAPRKLTNLASKDILLVTGEASYHAPYDYCTAKFLVQAGCEKTKHVELGDAGIHGNGHMFFMERNSDDIQKLVSKWIQSI